MIAREAFRALKLSDFVPPQSIRRLGYKDIYLRHHTGESFGSIQFVWQIESPFAISKVVIGFDPSALDASRRLLEAIGLGIRAGMNKDALARILGEPLRTCGIGSSRNAYVYRAGADGEFTVVCLAWNDRGLDNVIIQLCDPHELPRLDQYCGQTVDELIALEGKYETDSIVLAFERSGPESIADWKRQTFRRGMHCIGGCSTGASCLQ